MNEQNILKTLMQNPGFKKAFKELLLHDKDLAAELGVGVSEKNVYVWCAEMTDVGGGIFYHPIIAPKTQMIMPDIDYMMNVENYSMMASENQFEAHKYEPTIKLFRSVYGHVPTRLIAVPKATFEKLEEALSVLVINIVEEVNNCFDHLERIATMANTKADMLKMQLLMSVFGNMTTVATCFDSDMNMHDSANHNYDFYADDWSEDDCDMDDDDDWI